MSTQKSLRALNHLHTRCWSNELLYKNFILWGTALKSEFIINVEQKTFFLTYPKISTENLKESIFSIRKLWVEADNFPATN